MNLKQAKVLRGVVRGRTVGLPERLYAVKRNPGPATNKHGQPRGATIVLTAECARAVYQRTKRRRPIQQTPIQERRTVARPTLRSRMRPSVILAALVALGSR